MGPWLVTAHLYTGAGAAAWIFRGRATGAEAPVTVGHLPRLLAVAVAGALIAPACFVWGLGRTPGTTAALLLNFEAAFTVLLARLFYQEPVGRRVAAAMAACLAGGALLLPASTSSGASGSIAGVGAVLVATLGWAADNTLTRPLADLDPARVVACKAGLGASMSLAVALALGEIPRGGANAAGLIVVGAVGYGLSLRFYLLSQRRIGAGRTGSIFAVAPFIGAALAYALGDRSGGPAMLAAAFMFAVGVYLHLTEHHGHLHHHEVIEHDHAHRHDDMHHDHVHDPPFFGEHSHPHRHEPRVHAHSHGPDVHHRHRHEP
jgi:drug/metabolite transporter (DMT)-like permease